MPRNEEGKACGTGGHPKKFITYQDIAELLGVSVPYVRRLVSQGKLNPGSLASIIDFYCRCRCKKFNQGG